MKLPRVLISYYDTVAIHKSASKPLAAGGLGVTSDIFGVANLRGNSTTQIPLSDIISMQERFAGEISDDASKFIAQINEELMTQLRASELAQQLGVSKKILVSEAVGVIERRLQMIQSAFSKSAGSNERSRGQHMLASRLLMHIQQQLAADLLNIDEPSLEAALGYESELFSQNTAYLTLVRNTTEQLLDSRGISILKDIIDPNEGLAISMGNGEKKMLSKDADGNFILRLRDGSQEIISDDDARDFALSQLPLGKLETLAIVAGGYTLHMGSEHGARPKIVAALGLTDQAASYTNKLRIGEDKEQAVEGLVIRGTATYIPLPMAIVLLGTEGIIEILHHSLLTRQSIELDIKELKNRAAKNILDKVLAQIQGL